MRESAWHNYIKLDIHSHIPNHYGVYMLGNGNEIAYIGEGHLHDRLIAHFAGGSDPIVGVSRFWYEKTGSKERAVQRQNALLKWHQDQHGKLPRFNQKSRG